MKIISVKNLYFSYHEPILKNITFDVEKGDYLGIIGPNGSGKTTLLKLILGILKPEKGTIKVFGEEIGKFKEWNKIGYIPQKATQIDKALPLTVKELVGLTSNNEKILEALKKTNMEKFIDKKLSELSGGQQQRVFISKELAKNPELLILDEPTTGIDKKSQEDFYKLLGKLNKEEITIIIVSHDISYITKYVKKVACLNQVLLFHGTHEEFCSSDVIDKVLGHEKHIICHTI